MKAGHFSEFGPAWETFFFNLIPTVKLYPPGSKFCLDIILVCFCFYLDKYGNASSTGWFEGKKFSFLREGRGQPLAFFFTIHSSMSYWNWRGIYQILLISFTWRNTLKSIALWGTVSVHSLSQARQTTMKLTREGCDSPWVAAWGWENYALTAKAQGK